MKKVLLLFLTFNFQFSTLNFVAAQRRITTERIEVTNRLDERPDGEAMRIVSRYKASVDSVMAPVLGESLVGMSGGRPESLLSNWAADVLEEFSDFRGNVRNRDLQLQYQTSFVSEKIPGVALSENAVSAFLSSIGEAYSHICEFMRNRVARYADKNIIIDGMLKDYNSVTGSLSEFSRKAQKKGSKDKSLMYAYSPQAMEPIAVKAYPGNMLDSTAISDFLAQYKVTSGLMIFDKGFHNDALFEYIDKNKDLAALIPLKSDSKLIAKYGMDNPVDVLEGYTDGTVMYKKVRMKNGKWLYAFRDAKAAYEQEVGYVERAEKNKNFSAKDYEQKRKRFGLIVFQSKRNLEPLNVYLAYLGRWEIEVFFDHYKNIVDRDEVNVHTDYRTYATELINFLTVIITMRVKKKLKKTGLSKNYSQKQIFRYLSKYKKVRSNANGKWESATMLKYISEICSVLGI